MSQLAKSAPATSTPARSAAAKIVPATTEPATSAPTTSATAEASAWRAKFPTLAERTYFATQCLGPLPAEAFHDLDDYKRSLLLRNRGLSLWVERMEEHHGLVEQLLHAPAGSVALAANATAAQANLAAAIAPTPRRNRIVTSTLDFHSSRYLWAAQARRGFCVTEVPAADGATLSSARLIAELDERVALVCLALVSPRSGALADLAPIVAAAHAVGARVIVDAYQAVGVVPIDVAALAVDALVGGTHKWLCGGGTGLAFLYVEPAWADALLPAYPGWLAHRELLGFKSQFEPHAGARRFQQGTPALEPIYTARAGLRFVLDVGVERIRARTLALGTRLHDGVSALGLRVRTPREAARRGGMIVAEAPDGPALVERLAAQGIDIDHRPEAGIRVAPHFCTTEDECAQLLEALGAALAERRP
jgi:kynureninase